MDDLIKDAGITYVLTAITWTTKHLHNPINTLMVDMNPFAFQSNGHTQIAEVRM